ncbi:MAG: hypothetical protein NUV97_03540 [archaeon]|nr:hypothetical protein [archaeon]MCR4323909.1 hypothetical protein [Nanoarchaeota archaeon]
MKRGQVTIFIIVAIVIVVGIILYFAIDWNFSKTLPVNMEPVYDYYKECLTATALEGISLLGEQGGYIEVPEFVPGSQYMPFSSQLDFLGQPVPYWMYVSGNNLLREQVPTETSMEEELSKYVRERVSYCDFTDFELAGYDIYVDEDAFVGVQINDYNVDLNIDNVLTIFFENQSAVVSAHEVSVDSKLGRFYSLAKQVYDFEKTNMFLESYALDVMRLYAPVTGTEVGCSPKVFIDEEIRKDIVNGLVSNIPAIKLDGDYYDLSSQERSYFVTDAGLNIGENLNFVYSADWPTRIEISGDKVVEPVGLQQGLGMMGFCYTPYHLVYDIDFPVLVQFFDEKEIFQFPLAVIISKNQPREALPTIGGASIESPICDYKNQQVDVYTYDLNLNPVPARISFKCLNSVCDIGKTSLKGGDAFLDGQFPQCVNGFIVAQAEGYADSKVEISTNEERLSNILMNKKHNISIDLGNVKKAMVSFNSDDYSTTIVYPEMKSIELIEAYYNVTVYVYENSSLRFPGINERKCVDVPESGIAGFFGAETEKCYDINIPATDISFAIVGGGKTQEYVLDSVLEDSKELNINIPLFGLPTSLDDLQKNQALVESERVYLSFE